MSVRERPDRHLLATMLASFNQRTPEATTETVDSLELAWLIYEVEQRYDVELVLNDEQLSRMSTMTGLLAVLDEALDAPDH